MKDYHLCLPKCVSPAVALTSKMPPEMTKMETSKVPPPMSKIRTCRSSSVFLSRPYATAAAVGSLIILMTSKPAMAPASFVACLQKCVLKIADDLMIYKSVLSSGNFAYDVMKSTLRDLKWVSFIREYQHHRCRVVGGVIISVWKRT